MTGIPQTRDQFKERLGLVVIGVGALMARIDQHAMQSVLHNRALEFLDKRRAAAGQRAGKDDNPVFIFLLDLRAVFVPALQKRQRLFVGFVFQIMNGVADDAALDAGLFVGFQEIFNRQWRSAAPTALFGHFRRIDMGMPIDNHL